MTIHRRTLLALALAAPASPRRRWRSPPDDTIRIGLLATFEARATVLGEDGQRGALTALDEVERHRRFGKKVEFVKGSSDASPDSAARAVRKLSSSRTAASTSSSARSGR